MKQSFLKFPPQAKSYLPKYNSRRFPMPAFMVSAYKSDGGADDEDKNEIKNSADLLKSLNAMKADLEEKAKANVKLEVTEQLKAIQTAIEEIKNIKPEVTAEELKQIKNDLAVTVRAFDLLQTRVKNNKPEEVERKGFGDRVKEAIEENMDQFQKFNRKEIKKISMDIKAVADVSVGNITGGSVWGAQYRPGIIMAPNTVTQIRELIPVSTAGPGTDFYFMRENGVGEGSIAPTSEKGATAATTQATGLKPQFDLDLVESSVKFETIAGFMKLSRKAMLNIANLIGFLQRRLPIKLLDVESAQILYGNGTSPNLKGILAAGNFVDSTSGSSVLVEKIIDDLALLEDTYKRIATGIAMRPVDYFSFFKNKATGSGEYDLPQGVMFQNGVLYIMGVPVAKTTALTAGDYVVGDWVDGTELLVQEAMNVQFFEQDDKNVQTNQVTVRIEETVALPVYGPDYFIKGSTS